MTNSDYQRLTHVDSVAATRELRGLVQAGLVEQHSTRRWAYYTLDVPARLEPSPAVQTDEERILEYVTTHGTITNAEARSLLQIDVQQASRLLKKLHGRRVLERDGERRWARYRLL